jgi:energy-coupling factor transporter transmembrane protein EcfT
MILFASLLFGGETRDASLFGIGYSMAGLMNGLQMIVRAVVILVAVDGFSGAVEIGEVAGLAERLGLRGLGFSIGVAFNLLPALRQATANTWHSLWMRGGLRRKRLRSLRLMLVTILTSALQRGDEIALAAEARAFTPERSRAIPLRRGRLDGWLALPLLGILLAILLFP